MTDALRCNVCGAVSPAGELPPTVEPHTIRTATEDYVVDICRDCVNTRTLAEIKAHAYGKPGGMLDGPARGPYLLVLD